MRVLRLALTGFRSYEALELALVEERLRTSEAAGRLLLRQAAAQDFVVYSKPPLAGPEQVLRYLGRYTHRIAIGGERLVAHRQGQGHLLLQGPQAGWPQKDAHPSRSRVRSPLPTPCRPQAFVRVRHFGLLANGVKIHRLARARSLLGMPAPKERSRAEPESWQDTYRRLVGREPLLSPACRVGRLVVVAEILPASLGLG